MIGDQWIVHHLRAGADDRARRHAATRRSEYVDGTEHVTWSVDPAGIATVDRSGRVTPLAIGSFDVVARVGDKSRRQPRSACCRTTPATGRGEFVVSGCTGGHDFRECPRMMFPGEGAPGARRRYPFTLTLSQFRDQVTGTLREIRANGDIVAPVTGLVRLNGTLVLEATVPQTEPRTVPRVQLVEQREYRRHVDVGCVHADRTAPHELRRSVRRADRTGIRPASLASSDGRVSSPDGSARRTTTADSSPNQCVFPSKPVAQPLMTMSVSKGVRSC